MSTETQPRFENNHVAAARSHAGPSVPKPHRGEDPGHAGPEGEQVGDEEEMSDEAASRVAEKPSAPDVGMGASIPEHETPDGNPIDPRVF